ncbi:MAG: plasmid mobilization relaxosome protein MobC [Hyphomicrobiaceae bacterium]
MPRRGYRKGISDAKPARPCYARTRIATDQLERLNIEADQRGVTISTLLARLISAHQKSTPAELPRRSTNAELIRELCREGNNLNQIAHHANLSRLPALERDARSLLERINALVARLA